jgi:hypothetical protein
MFSTFDFLESLKASQPIEEIRNYFGEQIAFYFLWLSYTTQASFFAVIPGLALTVVIYMFQPQVVVEGDQTFSDVATPEQKTQAGWMAIFSFSAASLYCFGGMLYVKGWLRLQNYFCCLWDPAIPGAADGHRPDYQGDMVPNPINQNKKTKVYPKGKAACRRFTSITVVVIFIGGTIAAVGSVYFMRQVLQVEYGVSPQNADSIVSMLFSIQITVFQLIWNAVSAWLVEFTNPRTDEDAKNMSVQFLFPFSFVSTYANIAFHAFYTAWGEECMTENCIKTMRPSLIAVVGPAVALQVVSMLIPYAKYRYSLHSEMQALATKGEEPKRAFVESQAKRPTFAAVELNTEMNTMVILLGYVLLFGFAAPIVATFVCIAFLVKIRIDAFKLCSVFQRVTPQMQFTGGGIGEWNEVLKAMVKMAQWTCIAVPLFNLEYFNLSGSDNWIAYLVNGQDGDAYLTAYQKIMLVFVFKEIVDRVTSFFEYNINEHSSTEMLMDAKRGKVAASFATKMSATLRKMHKNNTKKDYHPGPHPDESEDAAENAKNNGDEFIKLLKENAVPKLSDKPGALEQFNWQDFAVATNKETYFGK